MNNKVKWLAPDVYAGDYQYYRQWATEAWINSGGKVKNGINIPFNIKKVMGKLNAIAHAIPNAIKRKEALIVCCGAFPTYAAWPYMYTHEVIPLIWDCWPNYHLRLLKAIRECRIRTVFCTSSQVVSFINSSLSNVNAYWIPEGINIDAYVKGGLLKNRKIDILELGRQYVPIHSSIIASECHNDLVHCFSDNGKLLFDSFEELVQGLADSKITICYPRCDTHPEMAGSIETLTQRYWECMLAGTLIVGRAPQELIDFCGYNPVIELKKHTIDEIIPILENIDKYQTLCDKNREFVINNCKWENRMDLIIRVLKSKGYRV